MPFVPAVILLRRALKIAKALRALTPEQRSALGTDVRRLTELINELRSHGVDKLADRRSDPAEPSGESHLQPQRRLSEVVRELEGVLARLTSALGPTVLGGGKTRKGRFFGAGVQRLADKRAQGHAPRATAHSGQAARLHDWATEVHRVAAVRPDASSIDEMAEAAAAVVVLTRLEPFAAEHQLKAFLDASAEWDDDTEPSLDRFDARCEQFVAALAGSQAELSGDPVGDRIGPATIVTDRLLADWMAVQLPIWAADISDEPPAAVA